MGATPALDIVGLLPQRNCGECGEPLCITFASQLLGGKRGVGECPNLSAEGQARLTKALEPPIRRIAFGNGRGTVTLGEERVLYRHHLRFFHPTAIAVTLDDTLEPAAREARLRRIAALDFSRMGQRLSVDVVAVRALADSGERFSETVSAAKKKTDLPLALFASEPALMRAGLVAAEGEPVLICSATADDWAAMADLAIEFDSALAVEAALDGLEELVGKVKAAGVREIVLAPRTTASALFSAGAEELTTLRRSAIGDGRLGYPTIVHPLRSATASEEVTWGAALVAKYAGLLVLENDAPEVVYPLLALRQAIYTDPTVPTTVEPGLYTEGAAGETSPVLLTGNFAMTYSMVSSDVRSAGINAHVLVADAQGYSIGVACLLGTVTAEQVAALLDATQVREKVAHRRMIIPGLMGSLKEKLEEATGMEILVGPIDSRHIPRFIEESWRPVA